MVLGVDHPYEVKSNDTPSLLPDKAIAVRFHSVGGWGAITTGKNLGAIIGDLNDLLYERDKIVDELGNPKEIIHVSANPKYGSEKKGAPTSYFMIAAPERIRVNCDLRHVNVVLCCDPKAFTHCNPLDGMSEGGSLVWESEEEGEQAWERLPLWARKQIIDKNIRVFTLPGFKIARNATDRGDLQLRMQGNAFLGAFFAVSPMLQEFGITPEQFRDAVHKQYVKKFGRLGDAVVNSNMEVMTKGFELVREIKVGELEAPDRSTLRGQALLPVVGGNGDGAGCGSGCRSHPIPEGQDERTPLTRVAVFDAEFRSTYGYDQPASPLASLGVMAAGSGDTASKYVARRETPLYIPENCTQCMECIAVCPDTALPNCSQDIDTILRTAISNYVEDGSERQKMLALVPEIDKRTRELMRDSLAKSTGTPPQELIRQVTNDVNGFSDTAKTQFFNALDKVPMAYQKTNAIFATPEKKKAGRRRHLLHLRVGPLQGMRGLRHGLRRARGAADGAGDRGGERRARKRHRLPGSAAGYAPEVPRPVQRHATAGLEDGDAAQHADGAAQLRRPCLGRRRVRGLRREEHPQGLCGGDRGVHASALSRQSRSAAREGRPTGQGRRREPGRGEGAKPGRIRPAAPGRRAHADGARRRGRQGHEGAHGGARPHLRPGRDRRDHRGHAAGGVQPQEPPADRRPARQRHVGDGDGGAHRLQHGLRIDAAQQPASVSVDELALPGRHHRRLAPRRKLHRRSWPPVGDPGAACRCAAAPRDGSHDPARPTTSTCTSPTR